MSEELHEGDNQMQEEGSPPAPQEPSAPDSPEAPATPEAPQEETTDDSAE